MKLSVRRFGSMSLGALAIGFALSAPSFAQSSGKNAVEIRGRRQSVYYYPATGQKLNRKILFAPGDGGWRGWAITIAQTISSWGYDVYGLDTKSYLEGLTAKSACKEPEVMADFRDLAKWMTSGSSERVMLVGWSEGAGLAVLAASDPNNKKIFSGLVAFGMVDVNALGWSWKDNITFLTGSRPNEPSFQSSKYLPLIAPLRLQMIQSSRDEYTSLDEAQKLAAAAKEPKRFTVVKADDHKFNGNTGEFFRTLREGLQWIN